MPLNLPTFTVVDLVKSSVAGSATAINTDGWVCGWSQDPLPTPFFFLPQPLNSASGTTVQITTVGGQGQALGINNRVDVVGWTDLLQGSQELAAFWQDCAIGGPASSFVLPTLTATPGGVPIGSAHANDINDNRLIVGWSELSQGGTHHAVVWDGSITSIPIVALQEFDPDLASEAFGINNQGTIVGSAQTRDPAGNIFNRAVVWDANSHQMIADLGTLASVIPVIFTDLNAEARAINDTGMIVGVGDLANPPIRPRAGFIVPPGGSMQLMPMTPGPGSGAWDISPNGTFAITITVLDPANPTHGTTYDLGQGLSITDLGPLSGGWTLTDARGVNDQGQICGQGSSPFTSNHALLLVL